MRWVVDDTLAHKRGNSVWGLGWFRDAVASTKKRVAADSGHNWVVVAVAVCLPLTKVPIVALPLLARLHLPGKGQPRGAELAKEMLSQVLGWWPGRRIPPVRWKWVHSQSVVMQLPAQLHGWIEVVALAE